MGWLSVFFKSWLGGIPWQAWVAAILLAAFAATGYTLHRKIVEIEVMNVEATFKQGLEAANTQLELALKERNDALSALDQKLYDAVYAGNAETATIIRGALERINARLKDDPDPYCSRCFSPVDDLRITRVPKR